MSRPAPSAAGNKIWGGRFDQPPNEIFYEFQRSFPFDRRLLPYELAVDRAWAAAIQQAGILTPEETHKTLAAIDDTQLRQLCNEFQRACDDAGRRWFEARRHAETQRLDASTPGIRAIYTQPPYEGEKAVALVRDLYVKLSQHIEKLLRG